MMSLTMTNSTMMSETMMSSTLIWQCVVHAMIMMRMWVDGTIVRLRLTYAS